MTDAVRTRIAPSPTGNLHVGTARAALFSELFARQQGGVFVIRIEDTDQERSKTGFEKNILEGLKWLGLEWQEGPDVGGNFGPYRQSERSELYRRAIARLLENEVAYQNEGEEAVILRVEDREVVFDDLIRGRVTTPSAAWGGDFVIARSLDDAVFHLAVVVDDALMEISHVIRGEDHVSNTARHILLQRALGYSTPTYAHLPLLLDGQRKKLSKRSGNNDLLSYRDQGYLPEAMLNYLALLGWNPKTDQEYFTHDELVDTFKLAEVQKGGAIFSEDKLVSINKAHLRAKSKDELKKVAADYSATVRGIDLPYYVSGESLAAEQQRVGNLQDLISSQDMFEPSKNLDYPPELLVWRKITADETIAILKQLIAFLEDIPEKAFSKEELSDRLLSWITETNQDRGDVLWPMRVALTGQKNSPGPFEVAAVLGKSNTLARLTTAVGKLS